MVQNIRIEERLDRAGVDFSYYQDGVIVHLSSNPRAAKRVIEQMQGLGLTVADVDFEMDDIWFREPGMGLGL